jgi:hypothetical protein
MAKKQTRRSISVSRTTYERLKAFCETNNISMSQLVETRVNDFLGGDAPAPAVAPRPMMPRPAPIAASAPRPVDRPVAAVERPSDRAFDRSFDRAPERASEPRPAPSPVAAPVVTPMTSAAARFAVEPPPPIIKPRQDTAAPKPAEKRPEQIFTF